MPVTSANVGRFSEYIFTLELSSDCITNWSLKIPSYLKRVVKCKCQETTDNLKQMSRLTINFDFNLLQLVMFSLIYMTVKNSCCSHWSMPSSTTCRWEAATICPRPLWPRPKMMSESRMTWATSSLPRPLCYRLRPDVRDRQTDVRQHHRLISPPRGQGHNNTMLHISIFFTFSHNSIEISRRYCIIKGKN